MEEATWQSVERFALRARGGPLELGPTWLRHPRSTLLGTRAVTPYRDVTHVMWSRRGLRLATRQGTVFLGRRAFEAPDEARRFVDALLDRIGQLPGGAAQRAAMARLDERWLRPAHPRIGRVLALLCLAVFLLQVLGRPTVDLAGEFSAPLVAAGEWWRLVTANFLHASPAHLALNALGLVILGGLVERVVGGAATVFVMAASGAGAMLGSAVAGYASAVGASGIFFGLIGSLLWLEFRRPQDLPAAWRLPRRLFVGAVVAESLMLAFVPGIAHAAHFGGLLAGALATALASPPALEPRRPRAWLAAANLVVLGLGVVSFGWAARAVVVPDPAAVARRAEMLLAVPGIHPVDLNNEAWRIAISSEPTPGQLEVAERLARRAVSETRRTDPNLLDTLAEVLFAAGRSPEALEIIDEAILLAPGESYFREQRRRFLGERAPADRPDPPTSDGLPFRLPDRPEEPPGIPI